LTAIERRAKKRVKVKDKTCEKMATTETIDYNSFSVEDLKERLRILKAKTNGNKSELVKRLMQIDPMGSIVNAKMSENIPEDDDVNEARETMNQTNEEANEILRMRRELEISKKERELARKELELVKRENELLQNMRRLSVNVEALEGQRTNIRDIERNVNNDEANKKPNITAIAELLSSFDGRSNTYETWERQVIFLKNTYKLSDDLTKVMIGLRLKGKAIEWLHSKPEHISLSINDLLRKLKEMFYHQSSKIVTRKQFEQRVWRRDETFSSYYHDKIILANRIPIDDDETIEYVIEGIPDPALRDQARIQRLNTRESLLEAFEKISLRGRNHHGGAYSRNEDKIKQHKADAKTEKDETTKTVKRCHNCGLPTHVAIDCPMKSKGKKCFECQEFGHIAAKCPKKVR